jgi:thioredoxin-like negative regulator of GroEL
MKTIFYFTADWCNPCKQTRPYVEELVRETENLTVLFIDLDIEHELAAELEVRSIPTLILFKDEKEIKRVSGAQTLSTLKQFIDI